MPDCTKVYGFHLIAQFFWKFRYKRIPTNDTCVDGDFFRNIVWLIALWTKLINPDFSINYPMLNMIKNSKTTFIFFFVVCSWLVLNCNFFLLLPCLYWRLCVTQLRFVSLDYDHLSLNVHGFPSLYLLLCEFKYFRNTLLSYFYLNIYF